MRTFECTCGGVLFFESTQCVKCSLEVGFCEHCRAITPWTSTDTHHTCNLCETKLVKCSNNTELGVCNHGVIHPAEPSDTTGPLCEYCQTTSVIPDLSVPGNDELWRRLSFAKARVLYGLEELGFATRENDRLVLPGLSFEFLSDDVKPVSTGHARGVITINVKEADHVEREKTRVEFDEPQRTLVGHFRHELGHYFWEQLVQDHCLAEFRNVFGDETAPMYADAQKAYYQDGPPEDWQTNYISAYATMHPWEDFAESFNAYLDMAAVVSTAHHFGLTTCDLNDFDEMILEYERIGIVGNELNRDIGLLDLVPEVFTKPVIEKLRFIHRLRRNLEPTGRPEESSSTQRQSQMTTPIS
ncbi:zinc-binding metallopeptidase family protein [Thalassoroseus pseudoceratinae]|uniref:zinc-binding metallopeptidase family protein n=1 Tax=Thalassoroseus pseudoceratinae TaxID=2713176 RepID=UPI00141F5EE8|nr:putative zinc-binding metallopeptidase [Thalassoroseus pseudoceratinae]